MRLSFFSVIITILLFVVLVTNDICHISGIKISYGLSVCRTTFNLFWSWSVCLIAIEVLKWNANYDYKLLSWETFSLARFHVTSHSPCKATKYDKVFPWKLFLFNQGKPSHLERASVRDLTRKICQGQFFYLFRNQIKKKTQKRKKRKIISMELSKLVYKRKHVRLTW